jgi:hypothetical protein
MVGIPQDLWDWEGGTGWPSLMNMRSSSATSGGIPLGLPVVCRSFWGKAYRSVTPGPLLRFSMGTLPSQGG